MAPSLPSKVQTLKQAKAAYRKTSNHISPQELKRIERRVELQERAERIQKKVQQGILNKRKKQEQERKRREQRRKMGIGEMGPKLSPRQKRLEEVFGAGHVRTEGKSSEAEERGLKGLDEEDLISRRPLQDVTLNRPDRTVETGSREQMISDTLSEQEFWHDVLQPSASRHSPRVPGIHLSQNLAPLPLTQKMTTVDTVLPLPLAVVSTQRNRAVSEFSDKELEEAYRGLPDDHFRQPPTNKIVIDLVHLTTRGPPSAKLKESNAPTNAGESDFEDQEFEEACGAIITRHQILEATDNAPHTAVLLSEATTLSRGKPISMQRDQAREETTGKNAISIKLSDESRLEDLADNHTESCMAMRGKDPAVKERDLATEGGIATVAEEEFPCSALDSFQYSTCNNVEDPGVSSRESSMPQQHDLGTQSFFHTDLDILNLNSIEVENSSQASASITSTVDIKSSPTCCTVYEDNVFHGIMDNDLEDY